jgi:hypothetical protein
MSDLARREDVTGPTGADDLASLPVDATAHKETECMPRPAK